MRTWVLSVGLSSSVWAVMPWPKQVWHTYTGHLKGQPYAACGAIAIAARRPVANA